MDIDDISDLKPCPLCAAGETSISATHLPPRMSGPGALISVEVRHFCPRRPGVVHNSISIRGRDRQSVVDAWNYRP
jgi:hypothetical protein